MPEKWHNVTYYDYKSWEPKIKYLAEISENKPTKIFSWYQEWKDGNSYDIIEPYVLKIEKPDGSIAFVKQMNYNPAWKILKKIYKQELINVDMTNLTEDECHAMGELICGTLFHGQLLGSLLDEIRICRQKIEKLDSQINPKYI